MKMSRVRFLPRAPSDDSLCTACNAGYGSGRVRHARQGTANGEALMFSDFKKFVLRGNVVDLAVAVVVGVAFTAMVTAFVADIITPLIAAIFGKPNFSSLTFTLHHSTFKYGSFVNAVVSFAIVATVVFFAVVVPLTALMRRLNVLPKEEVKPETRACPQCLSDIPVAAHRCAFCTSEVPVETASASSS